MSINDFRLYGSNKKAGGSLDLSAEVEETEVVAAIEEQEESSAEVIAEEATAEVVVPTSASKKAEIKDYLMYEHGIDPDDLDLTKAELLALVEDLK